jgi:predicted HNH restriction endonuclease
MKIKLIIVIVVSSILLFGCSLNKEVVIEKDRTPEEVISTYFDGYKEKDTKKIYATLTNEYKKKHPVSSFSLDNIDSTTLFTTKEITNEYKVYLMDHHAKERGIAEENIKLYKVTFEQVFVDDEKSAVSNGEFLYDFILIREDNNSPWLINRMGQF